MSTQTVTINVPHLENVIRNYLATLVYEDEIPQEVDMAITLLVEASRPTPCAPDVATATPEEEALLILNECITKLQSVTRHAGNT